MGHLCFWIWQSPLMVCVMLLFTGYNFFSRPYPKWVSGVMNRSHVLTGDMSLRVLHFLERSCCCVMSMICCCVLQPSLLRRRSFQWLQVLFQPKPRVKFWDPIKVVEWFSSSVGSSSVFLMKIVCICRRVLSTLTLPLKSIKFLKDLDVFQMSQFTWRRPTRTPRGLCHLRATLDFGGL